MKKIGYTLIELLVVIIIIGMLATISFNFYTRSVERARQTEALVVLSQIHAAVYRYYNEFRDSIVPNLDDLRTWGIAEGAALNSPFYVYQVVNGIGGAAAFPLLPNGDPDAVLVTAQRITGEYQVGIENDRDYRYTVGTGPGL